MWLAALVMLLTPASRAVAQVAAPAEASHLWTLEEVVSAALAQHPLVEAAGARADAARARRLVVIDTVRAFFGVALAQATSAGSEVQRPLATVVIGGLLTSTALTLIVLPVLYQWLEERWPAWAATIHTRMKRRHGRALGAAHV